jgi:hypothetical protein
MERDFRRSNTRLIAGRCRNRDLPDAFGLRDSQVMN